MHLGQMTVRNSLLPTRCCCLWPQRWPEIACPATVSRPRQAKAGSRPKTGDLGMSELTVEALCRKNRTQLSDGADGQVWRQNLGGKELQEQAVKTCGYPQALPELYHPCSA